MVDPVIVHIPFSRRHVNGTVFTDALNLPLAEYQATTPATLEAQKDARFEAWKVAIATVAPAQPAPTVEDFATQKADVLEQMTRLVEQVAELDGGDAFVKDLLLQLTPIADAVGVALDEKAGMK